MQVIITPKESRRLDVNSSVPVETLMERAGFGVALAASRLGVGYGSRVSILAGPGNNGGDGYVAARFLSERGCAVTVHVLKHPAIGSAASYAASRAESAGVTVVSVGPPVASDLIIDALFGVGFRGVLPVSVLPWLNHEAPVLAVDIPSGLDGETGSCFGPCFAAVATVTFHALKLGHLLGRGPDQSGHISVIDIGLEESTPELRLCELEDAPAPPRQRITHKWRAGSVLVVGGAPGISGAPVLAARSALHMGAGAVSVACPGGIAASIAAAGPGMMTWPVGTVEVFGLDDAKSVLEHACRFDVMVLGPGLGAAAPGFVENIVEQFPGRLLLDADGLNALDGLEVLAGRVGQTLLTPHAGEFERLSGEEASYLAAERVVTAAGVSILLKGNPTFVLGAERWVVTSGGPELASIGTGDVLAGMAAALWARGLDMEVAARSAAYRHGLAGADIALAGTVTAENLSDAVGSYAW